jgi:hypothetical protein
VWEQVGYSFEGFDRAFGAAWKINDEGLTSDGGDSAGKDRGGSFLDTFAANFFGDAGNGAISDFEGGFGSGVAWTQAGAAGSEEDVDRAGIGEGRELLANFGGIVGTLERGNDGPAELFAA